MSLNQLTLDQRKPWLDVRVEDLRVDGTLTASVSPSSLPNSGVTAGTYSQANITVDSKGLITAASDGGQNNYTTLYAGGMATVSNPTTDTILTATSPSGLFILPANTIGSNYTFSVKLFGNLTSTIANTMNFGLAIGPVGSPVPQVGFIGIANTSSANGGFTFEADLKTDSGNINMYGIGKYTNVSTNSYFGSITYAGATNIPLQVIPYVRLDNSDPSAGLTGLFCKFEYSRVF